ncbi:hypothetical protein [Bacillus luti]
MEIEIIKKVLEEQGIKGKKLEEIVAKTVLEQEKQREEEQKNEEMQKTVEETAKILEKSLGSKWNGAKVRRFIASDELKVIDPNPPKRIGFRIHIDEINRFIEWESMTKEDWKKRCVATENDLKKLQEELEKAKEEIEKLKAAKAPRGKRTETNVKKDADEK